MIKKEYLIVQPEVISGIGENTTGNNLGSQDQITNLHIEMEDWLGDDLMECFPCYIVTENFKKIFSEKKNSGYIFDDLEITFGEYFEDNFQLEVDLPKFYWLKITGIKNDSDVFIDEKLKLNVSNQFLDILKKEVSIKHLEINPQKTDTDDFLANLFKK
jgi:hypothetical protein